MIDHQDKEFGKEAYRITPIKKKPYYGCVLGGRILCTFDGLRINTKMEVLDEKHDPIPGLYAAGNDVGGFFWGSYNDRVPGFQVWQPATRTPLAVWRGNLLLD
ncbi:FAD-binding protein [Lactobacillus delbrueckii]|uniref:FAD-binding protein n=1 Tax=Lactobacillus delbrueckii TaxID=1584 RepID=UPI001E2AEDE2|nr:FAD-binding protein [Lactobacillus delbrueckii]